MTTYNYKGTKIKGTSTSPKVFAGSGISNAKHNQLYLNLQTGHVYVCDTPGKASVATWKYHHTAECKRPKIAVQSLCKPVRSGNSYTCKWRVPAELLNVKNGRRATGLTIDWSLGLKGTDPKVHKVLTNPRVKESTVNLYTGTFRAQGRAYTRSSFYPLTSKKLYYITCKVRGTNKKGAGKEAKATLEFAKPRKPTISAPSMSAQTGEVSVTVTTNAGTDARERYDTRYKVTVRNTRTGQTFEHRNSSSTATSFTLSYDPPDYQQLEYDEYIRITFEAWARGYAGDSEHVKRTYTVAFPAKTTITKKTAVRSAAGKATFLIKTNSSDNNPVDQVRLEYLANTPYRKAEQIPGDAAWTSTDIVDDAQCNAMSMPVTNLIPDPGNRTWVRVKSFHGVEAVLHRYSDPVYMKELETVPATAADDEIKILSATSGDDGRSAVVVMGWNADGQDDSTGTEVTWSEDADAWKSTDEPEMYTFTWSDGRRTAGGVTYQDSAELIIKGLDEGVPVFIRARRYMEGDPVSYGKYSQTAAVTPNVAPSGVVLDVPTYVAAGSSIPFSWTYGGGGTQRAWQLLTGGGTVIEDGEDAMGSYNLSPERAAALAVDNSLTVRVEVATGSDFVASEPRTITIVPAPTLALAVPATLAAQPGSFTATSSRECTLNVVVSAVGSTGNTPVGRGYQPGGETVWSGVVRPAWTSGEDGYTASVTLPDGLDLLDLASYTVTAVAVDASTGLRSPEASGRFAVAWAHQAIAPGDYVTITPNDYVDDEGIRRKTATIEWNVPTTVIDPETQEESEGAAATDVVDVYRLTGDGAVCIGRNYGIADGVTDEYAPFGDDLTLAYRIAVRTVDGDMEFSDVEYALDGDMMRFDWPGGVLELPYDISLSDSYVKDKTARKHLDGTTSIHYNEGVTRTGKQSSRLVRLRSQDEVDLVRELARYAGNAFVRLPDGCAYEACVEITDLSTDGALSSISISTTEADTTAAFMLPVPPAVDETEEQGA